MNPVRDARRKKEAERKAIEAGLEIEKTEVEEAEVEEVSDAPEIPEAVE